MTRITWTSNGGDDVNELWIGQAADHKGETAFDLERKTEKYDEHESLCTDLTKDAAAQIAAALIDVFDLKHADEEKPVESDFWGNTERDDIYYVDVYWDPDTQLFDSSGVQKNVPIPGANSLREAAVVRFDGILTPNKNDVYTKVVAHRGDDEATFIVTRDGLVSEADEVVDLNIDTSAPDEPEESEERDFYDAPLDQNTVYVDTHWENTLYGDTASQDNFPIHGVRSLREAALKRYNQIIDGGSYSHFVAHRGDEVEVYRVVPQGLELAEDHDKQVKGREFPVPQILSITTGILITSMDSIYEILDYLTGQSLFTHQLTKAADAVKGRINDLYPWLDGIVFPDFDRIRETKGDAAVTAEAKKFAAMVEDYYGSLALPEMHDAFASNGVLSDLAEMLFDGNS